MDASRQSDYGENELTFNLQWVFKFYSKRYCFVVFFKLFFFLLKFIFKLTYLLKLKGQNVCAIQYAK